MQATLRQEIRQTPARAIRDPSGVEEAGMLVHVRREDALGAWKGVEGLHHPRDPALRWSCGIVPCALRRDDLPQRSDNVMGKHGNIAQRVTVPQTLEQRTKVLAS